MRVMSARIQIWGLEIAQWLSALAALPEFGSSPRVKTAHHQACNSSFRGSKTAGFRGHLYSPFHPSPHLHIILFFNGICFQWVLVWF